VQCTPGPALEVCNHHAIIRVILQPCATRPCRCEDGYSRYTSDDKKTRLHGARGQGPGRGARARARYTRDDKKARLQGVGLALVDDMPDRTQLLKRRARLEPLLVVRVHSQPAVNRVHSGRFAESSGDNLRGRPHVGEHLSALLEVVGEAKVDVDHKLWLAWSLLEMTWHASREAEADGATLLHSLHRIAPQELAHPLLDHLRKDMSVERPLHLSPACQRESQLHGRCCCCR